MKEASGWPECGLPSVGVVTADEGVLDAEIGQVFGDQIVRASIQAVLCDQVVARPKQAQHRRADGRHSACRDERTFGSLERREFFMHRIVVGCVAQSRVADVVVAAFAVLLEGCRLKNRKSDGAPVAGFRLTGVHECGVDSLGAAHGPIVVLLGLGASAQLLALRRGPGQGGLS